MPSCFLVHACEELSKQFLGVGQTPAWARSYPQMKSKYDKPVLENKEF